MNLFNYDSASSLLYQNMLLRDQSFVTGRVGKWGGGGGGGWLKKIKWRGDWILLSSAKETTPNFVFVSKGKRGGGVMGRGWKEHKISMNKTNYDGGDL